MHTYIACNLWSFKCKAHKISVTLRPGPLGEIFCLKYGHKNKSEFCLIEMMWKKCMLAIWGVNKYNERRQGL